MSDDLVSQEDELLSLEQAMKELQVEEEQLKDLIRKGALRYVLAQGRVKIPRISVMSVKVQRMTSNTTQFAKQKRQNKRVRKPTEKENVSLEEAMTTLKVSEETLQSFISSERLRTVEVEGEMRVPITAIHALKIQMPTNQAKQSTRKLQKRKPSIKRKY